MRFGGLLGFHSIKSRLVLWIFLIFLVFLVLMVAGYYVTLRVVTEKTTSAVLGSVRQTDEYLSLIFDHAKELSFVLSTSPALQDLTDLYHRGRSNSYEEISAIDGLSHELMYQATLNPVVDSLYVYVPARPILLTSAPDVFLPGFFPVTSLPALAARVQTTYRWIGHYREPRQGSQPPLPTRDYVTSISRADTVNRALKEKTYIVVNFDEAWIGGILRGHQVFTGARSFLLSGSGTIVSASRAGLAGRLLSDVLGLKAGTRGELTPDPGSLGRVCVSDGGCYRSVFSRNVSTGLGILTLVPEREFLSEQRIFFAAIAALLILASAFYVMMVLRVVTRQVDEPISRLVALMRSVEAGDFSARSAENRRDELGYLFAGYDRMVGRLQGLIRDLAAEHALKSEMELKFLQAQVNPHFLYNTLDTINWIARKHGVPVISDIVRDLSRLYRSAFNRGRDEISVREAVQGIESYLAIHKHRLGPRLLYSVEVDPDLLDQRILNLTLQPVVENAVVHGIERDGGRIEVRARKNGAGLVFVVSDNGRGMSPETLRRVRLSLAHPGEDGNSGLLNVQRRMRLFYGEPYGIAIESTPGAGTTVEVTLPADGGRDGIRRRAVETSAAP